MMYKAFYFPMIQINSQFQAKGREISQSQGYGSYSLNGEKSPALALRLHFESETLSYLHFIMKCWKLNKDQEPYSET
jgi:hypothetical protein